MWTINNTNSNYKLSAGFKLCVWTVIFAFVTNLWFPPAVLSQPFVLPQVGTMLQLTPGFQPPVMMGLTINPKNPLSFDFIISRGDKSLQDEAFEEESGKLIKYFLASLTVPENEMWVNLSPTERNRIIPESFGYTEMGRDLLAQDYLLKQLTASLMYPEGEIGKKFWERIYEKAGTKDVPTELFNKVWIVPEKAIVYEHEGSAFVIDYHLKVMLEDEYLSLRGADATKQSQDEIASPSARNDTVTQMIRDIILPEIEEEVNRGETFANLRQIFQSMILAAWYKKALKESLLGRIYVDQNKVEGVDVEDKDVKFKIYEQYLETFKKGVYDYIKDEYDPVTQQIIPRKYFSGGVLQLDSAQLAVVDLAMAEKNPVMAGRIQRFSDQIAALSNKDNIAKVRATFAENPNAAMLTFTQATLPLRTVLSRLTFKRKAPLPQTALVKYDPFFALVQMTFTHKEGDSVEPFINLFSYLNLLQIQRALNFIVPALNDQELAEFTIGAFKRMQGRQLNFRKFFIQEIAERVVHRSEAVQGIREGLEQNKTPDVAADFLGQFNTNLTWAAAGRAGDDWAMLEQEWENESKDAAMRISIPYKFQLPANVDYKELSAVRKQVMMSIREQVRQKLGFDEIQRLPFKFNLPEDVETSALPFGLVIPTAVGRAYIGIDEAIKNAVDAIAKRVKESGKSQNGVVLFGVKVVNGNIVLEIADNGVGISRNVLSNFYVQGQYTTKPQEGMLGGKGIGLQQYVAPVLQWREGMLEFDTRDAMTGAHILARRFKGGSNWEVRSGYRQAIGTTVRWIIPIDNATLATDIAVDRQELVGAVDSVMPILVEINGLKKEWESFKSTRTRDFIEKVISLSRSLNVLKNSSNEITRALAVTLTHGADSNDWEASMDVINNVLNPLSLAAQMITLGGLETDDETMEGYFAANQKIINKLSTWKNTGEVVLKELADGRLYVSDAAMRINDTGDKNIQRKTASQTSSTDSPQDNTAVPKDVVSPSDEVVLSGQERNVEALINLFAEDIGAFEELFGEGKVLPTVDRLQRFLIERSAAPELISFVALLNPIFIQTIPAKVQDQRKLTKDQRKVDPTAEAGDKQQNRGTNQQQGKKDFAMFTPSDVEQIVAEIRAADIDVLTDEGADRLRQYLRDPIQMPLVEVVRGMLAINSALTVENFNWILVVIEKRLERSGISSELIDRFMQALANPENYVNELSAFMATSGIEASLSDEQKFALRLEIALYKGARPFSQMFESDDEAMLLTGIEADEITSIDDKVDTLKILVAGLSVQLDALHLGKIYYLDKTNTEKNKTFGEWVEHFVISLLAFNSSPEKVMDELKQFFINLSAQTPVSPTTFNQRFEGWGERNGTKGFAVEDANVLNAFIYRAFVGLTEDAFNQKRAIIQNKIEKIVSKIDDIKRQAPVAIVGVEADGGDDAMLFRVFRLFGLISQEEPRITIARELLSSDENERLEAKKVLAKLTLATADKQRAIENKRLRDDILNTFLYVKALRYILESNLNGDGEYYQGLLGNVRAQVITPELLNQAEDLIMADRDVQVKVENIDNLPFLKVTIDAAMKTDPAKIKQFIKVNGQPLAQAINTALESNQIVTLGEEHGTTSLDYFQSIISGLKGKVQYLAIEFFGRNFNGLLANMYNSYRDERSKGQAPAEARKTIEDNFSKMSLYQDFERTWSDSFDLIFTTFENEIKIVGWESVYTDEFTDDEINEGTKRDELAFNKVFQPLLANDPTAKIIMYGGRFHASFINPGNLASLLKAQGFSVYSLMFVYPTDLKKVFFADTVGQAIDVKGKDNPLGSLVVRRKPLSSFTDMIVISLDKAMLISTKPIIDSQIPGAESGNEITVNYEGPEVVLEGNDDVKFMLEMILKELIPNAWLAQQQAYRDQETENKFIEVITVESADSYQMTIRNDKEIPWTQLRNKLKEDYFDKRLAFRHKEDGELFVGEIYAGDDNMRVIENWSELEQLPDIEMLKIQGLGLKSESTGRGTALIFIYAQRIGAELKYETANGKTSITIIIPKKIVIKANATQSATEDNANAAMTANGFNPYRIAQQILTTEKKGVVMPQEVTALGDALATAHGLIQLEAPTLQQINDLVRGEKFSEGIFLQALRWFLSAPSDQDKVRAAGIIYTLYLETKQRSAQLTEAYNQAGRVIDLLNGFDPEKVNEWYNQKRLRSQERQSNSEGNQSNNAMLGVANSAMATPKVDDVIGVPPVTADTHSNMIAELGKFVDAFNYTINTVKQDHYAEYRVYLSDLQAMKGNFENAQKAIEEGRDNKEIYTMLMNSLQNIIFFEFGVGELTSGPVKEPTHSSNAGFEMGVPTLENYEDLLQQWAQSIYSQDSEVALMVHVVLMRKRIDLLMGDMPFIKELLQKRDTKNDEDIKVAEKTIETMEKELQRVDQLIPRLEWSEVQWPEQANIKTVVDNLQTIQQSLVQMISLKPELEFGIRFVDPSWAHDYHLERAKAQLTAISNLLKTASFSQEKPKVVEGLDTAAKFPPVAVSNKGMVGEDVGGIDFNPANMDLQIKRDGNGVPLPIQMQDLPNIKIDGLYPVIINITPITNPLPLLGMDKKLQPEAQLSQI